MGENLQELVKQGVLRPDARSTIHKRENRKIAPPTQQQTSKPSS